jgi:hypothetical protein
MYACARKCVTKVVNYTSCADKCAVIFCMHCAVMFLFTETPSPLVSMTALVEQAIAWTSQPQQQAVIVIVQLKVGALIQQ